MWQALGHHTGMVAGSWVHAVIPTVQAKVSGQSHDAELSDVCLLNGDMFSLHGSAPGTVHVEEDNNQQLV